jgi:hypothetical protein
MSRTIIRVLCVGLGVVTLAACGGSGNGPIDRSTIGVVADRALAALVPEVEGWARGTVSSATVATPDLTAQASASYARGEARIELVLTDTHAEPALLESLASLAGSDVVHEVENGYLKGTTIRGFPAVESWNHDANLGEVTVLVAGRFVASVTGASLDDIATLVRFVEAIDLDALADLSETESVGEGIAGVDVERVLARNPGFTRQLRDDRGQVADRRPIDHAGAEGRAD